MYLVRYLVGLLGYELDFVVESIFCNLIGKFLIFYEWVLREKLLVLKGGGMDGRGE